MKHLITGGNGFLGTLIAKELLKKGEKVCILDVIDDPDRSQEIEFIHGSVCNQDIVRKAMQGVNIVHHNAALVPLTKSGKEFWNVNVLGSECVAKEAIKSGVDAFIHMSSSAIFGCPNESPITNGTLTQPVEIYGQSKLEGEQRVMSLCNQSKLPLTVIRPRTILGQGRLGIFKILFDWILDNKNIYIIGSGSGLFQFIHAIDLMSFYMITVNTQTPGIYNVGTTTFSSLRNELETLIRIVDSSSKVISLPINVTIKTLSLLDKAGLSPLAPWHYLTYHKPFYFDTTPLTELGWTPQYSNQQMIQESYQWFLDNKNNLNFNQKSVHRRPVKEKLLWLLKKLS
ncbi:epimerase [Candidatus Marinamargulisbacteria bacterium SCGC AG-333-B06]|nr:epimerase [Candidatus Marinamargulisbacteria bacterium SCGC AG-333-B06]